MPAEEIEKGHFHLLREWMARNREHRAGLSPRSAELAATEAAELRAATLWLVDPSELRDRDHVEIGCAPCGVVFRISSELLRRYAEYIPTHPPSWDLPSPCWLLPSPS